MNLDKLQQKLTKATSSKLEALKHLYNAEIDFLIEFMMETAKPQNQISLLKTPGKKRAAPIQEAITAKRPKTDADQQDLNNCSLSPIAHPAEDDDFSSLACISVNLKSSKTQGSMLPTRTGLVISKIDESRPIAPITIAAKESRHDKLLASLKPKKVLPKPVIAEKFVEATVDNSLEEGEITHESCQDDSVRDSTASLHF